MNKVQSKDMVSSTPEYGMDSRGGSVFEITKSMENCASAMHSYMGFVQSPPSRPQFPCLMIDYKNRPGPLVTPSLVPMRQVAHTFHIQNETPRPAEQLDSDGHKCESDTICMLPVSFE